MCNVPFCGNQRQNVGYPVTRQAKITELPQFATRLREARKRAGLNQAQFAALGGVVMNSQNRYEAGATEPSASYLIELAAQDVDVLWILTGRKTGGMLSAEEGALLEAFNSLSESDRAALLTFVNSLSPRAIPADVPQPDPQILQEAFRTFREATPTNDPDELLHELAMQLPSILRAVSGAHGSSASAQPDTPLAPQAGEDDDRRASQPGRRT